ncbi:MAG: (d)CMP kinase [Caldilineaceae bacterium]|nr:(d)CMP kinase [Caldilineaceae bacterium]
MNAIAIDGPAASGKSTVGFLVGQSLGFLFFDTGVMYRAVAWAIQDRGISSTDSEAVGRMAEELPIGVSAPSSEEPDGRQATIQIGELDVTWSIRSPEVDRIVSVVAANSQVRQALTQKQRLIGLEHGSGDAGVVMVGRDIGTVVLPEAPLKIYLEAPLEERARRRYTELSERGKEANPAKVLEDMRRRDRIDSGRAVAPLRPAHDAHKIQTYGATIQEVVEQILLLAEKILGVGLASCGQGNIP